jgi:hypothetical protein
VNEEASEMPRLSKETASDGADYGAVVDRGGELDGYHASFMLVREDVDSTPLLKGLPDDRCRASAAGSGFRRLTSLGGAGRIGA